MASPNQIITSILKHDRKVNSYKIALVRAINDVALNFPDLAAAGQSVAVPLKLLAELWLAYYWPFADPEAPILQGADPARRRFHPCWVPAYQSTRSGENRSNSARRPRLKLSLVTELSRKYSINMTNRLRNHGDS